MRGSPPLHLALFMLGFALLAVPLARLTFARPAVVVSGEADGVSMEPQASTPALLRLRFAHVPTSVSVKLDGRDVLPAAGEIRAGSSMEASTDLIIPKEGIELIVSAAWPAGTPDTALTLDLEPDGLDMQSQTRWSNGAQLSEVVAFQWNR